MQPIHCPKCGYTVYVTRIHRGRWRETYKDAQWNCPEFQDAMKEKGSVDGSFECSVLRQTLDVYMSNS